MNQPSILDSASQEIAPADYPAGRWRRLWTGLASAVSGPVAPLGRLWPGAVASLASEERLSRGLVLILTGIEGLSALSIDLARGLDDGGVSSGIRVVDWTTRGPWLLRHLRNEDLHVRAATAVSTSILEYQSQFPGRPVTLIGYSGGAGVTLRALEMLPTDCRVDGVVLLCSAVSSRYDLRPAMSRIRHSLWNIWSPLDFGVLGLGTLVCGTFDGRHEIASGAQGFLAPNDGLTDNAESTQQCQFRQLRYRLAWLRNFHGGGHFGPMNRVFAAEVLAQLFVTAPTKSDVTTSQSLS